MDPEEIWAEIERRKDRVRDLKLREELWLLYSSVLLGYAHALANDAELIYPPIRESLSIAHGVYQFTLGDIAYKVVYREAKREKKSQIAHLSGIENTTTPITLTLHVDRKLVFEFNMKHSVTSASEMPVCLVLANLFRAKLIGPAMKVAAEVLNTVQVCADGSSGEVAPMQLLKHELT